MRARKSLADGTTIFPVLMRQEFRSYRMKNLNFRGAVIMGYHRRSFILQLLPLLPMLRIEKYANREIVEAEVYKLPKLVLPFDLRRKSRFRTTLANGTEASLFLPRGSVLRDGDLLEAEDGTLIRVESALEYVLFVTAKTPNALMRAAYHLGNRHIPVELGENFLKLEIDPVLQEMLVQLGVTVREEYSPFQPEGGAYGGGHRHGHDETFAEDYSIANQVFSEHHVHSEDKHHRHTHSHDDSHSDEHS
jgi:urease accessory protein